MKFLSSALIFILLSCSLVVFILHQLTSSDIYIKSAQSTNFYGRIIDKIPDKIPKNDLMKPFSNDDIKTVVSSVDGTTFYGFLADYIDGYLSWLTGKTGSLSFTVNVSSLKSKIKDTASAKVSEKYHNLPYCDKKQYADWGFEKAFPVCQLPEDVLSTGEVQTMSASYADRLIDSLPTTISPPAPTKQLSNFRNNVVLITSLTPVIWILTVIFILIHLIAFRYKGLASLAITIISLSVVALSLNMFIWDQLAKIANLLLSNFKALSDMSAPVSDVVSGVVSNLKYQTGVVLIIGLGFSVFLIILSLVSRFTKPANQPVIKQP